MAMVYQLSITLPSVVMLCIGAFFLALLRGDAVSANILAATALGGQAVILFTVPAVLQQGETALQYVLMFAFLITAFVDVLIYQSMASSGAAAMVVLPLLGAIALPVAGVVSFRLLRTAIASDCQSYQKQTETENMSWPKV
jgi:hypothetical protein